MPLLKTSIQNCARASGSGALYADSFGLPGANEDTMSKVTAILDSTVADVAKKWDDTYGAFRKAIIKNPRTWVFGAFGAGALLGFVVGLFF